jgi:hypothetical protein
MPDFEIRYFNADGTLANIVMTSYASDDEALDHARRNIEHHARFEIRRGNGTPLPQR